MQLVVLNAGAVDLQDLMMERGADIFRSKGVLCIAGTDDKCACTLHNGKELRKLLRQLLCDCLQWRLPGLKADAVHGA